MGTIDCVPNITAHYELWMDFLSALPACFLITGYSIYVYTFARILQLLRQLTGDTTNPTGVRLLVFLYTLASILIYSTSITSRIFGASGNGPVAKVTFKIFTYAASASAILISVSFVYYSHVLRSVIQSTIDQAARSRLDDEMANNEFSSNSISSQLDGPETWNDPLLQNSNSSNSNPPQNPYGPNLGFRLSFSRQSRFRVRFATQPQTEVMTRTKNPIEKVYRVSIVCMLTFCMRAVFLPVLVIVGNGDAAWFVLPIYFIISELIPTLLMLSLFDIAVAPTNQWEDTYGVLGHASFIAETGANSVQMSNSRRSSRSAAEISKQPSKMEAPQLFDVRSGVLSSGLSSESFDNLHGLSQSIPGMPISGIVSPYQPYVAYPNVGSFQPQHSNLHGSFHSSHSRQAQSLPQNPSFEDQLLSVDSFRSNSLNQSVYLSSQVDSHLNLSQNSHKSK